MSEPKKTKHIEICLTGPKMSAEDMRRLVDDLQQGIAGDLIKNAMGVEESSNEQRVRSPMALWGQPLTEEQTTAIIRGAWDALQTIRSVHNELVLRRYDLTRHMMRLENVSEEHQALKAQVRDLDRSIDKCRASLQTAGLIT